MWTTNEIAMTGSKGRQIHNRYYPQQTSTDKLCVVIAGFGYTLESPYLYFSKMVPFERGFDVLAVDFDYGRNQDFLKLPEEQQDSVYEADVEGVAAHIVNNTHHQHLLFIGKSLGSTSVFSLLQNEEIEKRAVGAVWLTPSKERFGIYELMKHSELPGFVITGSQDAFVKDIDFGELSVLGHVTHYSVRGGDHSLETADRAATLRALETYLEKLETFVDGL